MTLNELANEVLRLLSLFPGDAQVQVALAEERGGVDDMQVAIIRRAKLVRIVSSDPAVEGGEVVELRGF